MAYTSKNLFKFANNLKSVSFKVSKRAKAEHFNAVA